MPEIRKKNPDSKEVPKESRLLKGCIASFAVFAIAIAAFFFCKNASAQELPVEEIVHTIDGGTVSSADAHSGEHSTTMTTTDDDPQVATEYDCVIASVESEPDDTGVTGVVKGFFVYVAEKAVLVKNEFQKNLAEANESELSDDSDLSEPSVDQGKSDTTIETTDS